MNLKYTKKQCSCEARKKRFSSNFIEKQSYLQEFNIEYTKFPGDESAHYRVYEDITEWLKQQGIDI